jgi:DNA replication protein DnaC
MSNYKEFIPCDKCKNKIISMPGYYYIKSNNNYPDKIKECECHIQWYRENWLHNQASKSGLWTSDFIMNYNPMTDYIGSKSYEDMIKLVTYISFYNKYKTNSLYLYGSLGTQKTTLCQWAGLQLLRSGFNVKFVTMQGLIMSLEPDYNSTEKNIDYDIYDCLIIDECFDPHKVTVYKSGYQFPFLDTFLRDRIDHKKLGCIFISNINPNNITKSGYTDSIQSFVIRNTIQKNTLLVFEDNYTAITSTFDPSDLKIIKTTRR